MDEKSKRITYIEDNEENGWNVESISSSFSGFQKILCHLQQKSMCLDIFLGILILLVSVCISMVITLWPQHDCIKYPEYWYEPVAPIIFGFIMIVSASNICECYLVMKVDLILTWKAFFKLFFVTASSFTVPYIIAYVIWTHGLELRHPMPFVGQLCALIQSIIRPIAFWFLFPASLRVDDREFRKKLIGFTTLFPLRFIMAIVYSRIASTITKLPNNIQWCMAIFLPFVKKFNIWWTTKIGYRAAGCIDQSARLSMICAVTCTHSFVLTFILGSNISSVTAYLIMVAEFITNTYECFKIIRLHRQNSILSKEQKSEALNCLALREYLEVLIPVTYCSAFTIAFYGPNANILGNIRNEYWQFVKVDNLVKKLRII